MPGRFEEYRAWASLKSQDGSHYHQPATGTDVKTSAAKILLWEKPLQKWQSEILSTFKWNTLNLVITEIVPISHLSALQNLHDLFKNYPVFQPTIRTWPAMCCFHPWAVQMKLGRWYLQFRIQLSPLFIIPAALLTCCCPLLGHSNCKSIQLSFWDKLNKISLSFRQSTRWKELTHHSEGRVIKQLIHLCVCILPESSFWWFTM